MTPTPKGKPSTTAHAASAILTRRQVEILELIQKYRQEHRCSPTMQEMAEQLGLSKVTIFEHVDALVDKGWLSRDTHKARSLTLNRPWKKPKPPASRTPTPALAPERPLSSCCFPLAGSIAAGTPLEAIEQQESLNLGELFAPSRETFALRVRGESMINEHIRNGDYVLVEKGSTARDGQIVVALLENGEATLKKIYRQGNRFRLEGANPTFAPLLVNQVQIQGVVVGVIRRC